MATPPIAAPAQPVMTPTAPTAPTVVTEPAPQALAQPQAPAAPETPAPAPETPTPAAPASKVKPAKAEPQPAPAVNTHAQPAEQPMAPDMNAMMTAFAEFSKQPYKVAIEHGRYKDNPAIGSVLMAIQSEVAEAHSAFTSGKRSDAGDIAMLRDFMEHGKDAQFAKYFNIAQKSTFEDELADIILLTMSIAGYYGVDIASAVELKHKYNTLRTEHSTTTI